MRYYKKIDNGYLDSVGAGLDGIEIAEDEYNALLALILNKPAAPVGYEYWITEAGEYELVEVPVPEIDEDEELTAEAALDIIMGGGGA